jgi:hypothetical protein
MKCESAREEIVDALKDGPSIELENHLRECAECREMLGDLTSISATLHEMPEIEPAPFVLNSIKRQIGLGQVRTGRLRRLFRMAWAAAALGGVVTAVMLLSTPPSARVVAYVSRTQSAEFRTAQGLALGQTYDFAAYASLTLPDIGTVRVRENTRLQFGSASELTLLKGEVFIEVTQKPRDGFRVRTEKLLASVAGTEFGVTPTDVYVRTGSVHVQAGDKTAQVGKGEMVRANGALQRTRVDPLTLMEWVREYETPAVRLALVSNSRLLMNRTEKVLLRLTNSSRYWPIYLRSMEPGGFLQLKLSGKSGETFHVRIDEIHVSARIEDRLIRIEEGQPVEVEVTLKPDLFASLGKSGVFQASFVYTSGGDQDPRIWSGTVESRERIEIEIR